MVGSFVTTEVPRTTENRRLIEPLNTPSLRFTQADILVKTIPFRDSDIKTGPASSLSLAIDAKSTMSNPEALQKPTRKKRSGQLKYLLAKKARDANRTKAFDRSAGSSNSSHSPAQLQVVSDFDSASKSLEFANPEAGFGLAKVAK